MRDTFVPGEALRQITLNALLKVSDDIFRK